MLAFQRYHMHYSRQGIVLPVLMLCYEVSTSGKLLISVLYKTVLNLLHMVMGMPSYSYKMYYYFFENTHDRSEVPHNN